MLKDVSSEKSQRDIFWSKYTPWEVEQIACVMEYFYARLIPRKRYLPIHCQC